MGPPTAQEAAAQQRLQAGVDAARVALSQQEQALSGAQTALQRFGVSGQNARDAQQRLRQEVAGVREAIQDLVPAYQGAATGASNAGETMVRTHRQIGDGVESISQQLARLQSFYAALQGFQGLKTMASDLAETADQVNNLQGRIKLVTGEGENFTRAWQGVTEVALRTHSALEETGVLFTRLAQAGKDAGLTTAQASAQSLALTETINQAIQLSGASAQASSAAITQLVQGLQGGALRGDEFNSVMEQSPRLARALADGLGVTTGELRKMAEAGLLTSDTVIKALQGQSQTLATEFSKLPPTVGRALQDLSTQWSLYVSDTDKATGASVTAASAISALANNLKTVAGLLIDLGQATTAFMALRLAQHFLGIGTAAQASAAAVAANNVQMVASGNAAATAAVGAGRFATILASLRTFTLIGLVANFKDIGTWIGEAAAKLAGYKDRTDELARADKLAADIAKESAADRARLAAAIQTAIDRTFDLSKAARISLADFEKLTLEGLNVTEALKKATDAFDLTKVQGIRDFSAVLEKLAADGKITANELRAAWSKALDGKDLAEFEAKARAAFATARSEAEKAAKAYQDAFAKGAAIEQLKTLKATADAAFAVVTREAERSAQLMDVLLREAVKRTGLEFEQLQGRVGTASRSAINDVEAIIAGLDKLKAEGVDTGRVLNASLSKAIDTADSEKALEAVRSQIEQVRQVLGDKIADGLLDQAKEKAEALRDAIDKATPGINSVREAMKLLGVTSEESLKKTATSFKEAYETMAADGTRSARELSEAFKKAAEAAIAANKGVAPSWVEAEAAARGYRVVIDESGKATLELANKTGEATGRMARGWHASREAIQANADALDELNMRYKLSADYTEREIALLARQAAALEKAAEAKRKYWNVDKDGFTLDANGQRQQMTVPTGEFVFNAAKGAGLTEAEALALMDKYFQNGKPTGVTAANGLNGPSRDWFSIVNDAISKAVIEKARQNAAGGGAQNSGPPVVQGGGGAGGSGSASTTGGNGGGLSADRGGATYIANITIPGLADREEIRFADPISQARNESLLRKLAQAKSTAIR